MRPIFQGMFPFSEQKWGTKETFGHFCLLCSGAAGRLQASGSHKSSPEMRLKCGPLHRTHGMEKRLHDDARSYRVPSRSAIHRRLQPASGGKALWPNPCSWGTRATCHEAVPISFPAPIGCSDSHEGALVQISI